MAKKHQVQPVGNHNHYKTRTDRERTIEWHQYMMTFRESQAKWSLERKIAYMGFMSALINEFEDQDEAWKMSVRLSTIQHEFHLHD